MLMLSMLMLPLTVSFPSLCSDGMPGSEAPLLRAMGKGGKPAPLFRARRRCSDQPPGSHREGAGRAAEWGQHPLRESSCAFVARSVRAEPTVAQLIKQFVESDDQKVLEQVGEALVEQGRKAIPSLVALLAHPKARVRKETLSLLPWFSKDAFDTVPKMLPLLHDEDGAVRSQAIAAIRHIRNPVAVDALMKLLKGQENLVFRGDACMALGDLGEAAHCAIPRLIQIMMTQLQETELYYFDIGKAASFALVNMSRYSLRKLVEVASSPDALEVVQSVALDNLSYLYENRELALPLAQAILKKKEVSADLFSRAAYYVAALRVDCRFLAASFSPYLQHRSSVIRLNAAGALTAIHPPHRAKYTKLLVKLLDDANPAQRRSAVSWFSVLAEKAASAAPHLLRLLNEDKPGRCASAIQALGYLGQFGAPALPRLRELTRSQHQKLRGHAKKAIYLIEQAIKHHKKSQAPTADQLSSHRGNGIQKSPESSFGRSGCNAVEALRPPAGTG